MGYDMSPKATPKQIKFIAILFDDLGYTSTQRRDWMKLRFGVSYADDLTVAAASAAIDQLKQDKDEGKLLRQVLEEEQEW